MGWAYCGKDDRGREIGYGITAICDKRGCREVINRGLGYLCGKMHAGEGGCGRYFCGEHQGWEGQEAAVSTVSKEPTARPCASLCGETTELYGVLAAMRISWSGPKTKL